MERLCCDAVRRGKSDTLGQRLSSTTRSEWHRHSGPARINYKLLQKERRLQQQKYQNVLANCTVRENATSNEKMAMTAKHIQPPSTHPSLLGSLQGKRGSPAPPSPAVRHYLPFPYSFYFCITRSHKRKSRNWSRFSNYFKFDS